MHERQTELLSKILITGMTSSHTSESANAKSLTFAGVLSSVLQQNGHEVVQEQPNVSWTTQDLDQYDTVLVGISPITSISSNYVYGALSAIDVLLDTGKLKLFIDSPEPTRITSSLRAIAKTPDNLTKPFYSYRKGFSHATMPAMAENLLDVINMLLEDEWPTTLYPALPWDSKDRVIKQLPQGAENALAPTNLDAYLISTQEVIDVEKRDKWVVDSYATNWVKTTASTLSHPIIPMKWNKGWDDKQVENQIASAIGSLVSPNPSGTWWTYRYIQSMNMKTPVATDWRESGAIDASWMYLASRIEDMSLEDQHELSSTQMSAYLANVPNRRDAAVELYNNLDLYSMKG